MNLDNSSSQPIYVQIAEWLEKEILRGTIGIDEKIYSQYQLAEMFNINPATAAKGLSLLADEHILYKKRGLGMFVAPEAPAIIHQRRKSQRLQHLLAELVAEVGRLGISQDELIQLIIATYRQDGEESN